VLHKKLFQRDKFARFSLHNRCKIVQIQVVLLGSRLHNQHLSLFHINSFPDPLLLFQSNNDDNINDCVSDLGSPLPDGDSLQFQLDLQEQHPTIQRLVRVFQIQKNCSIFEYNYRLSNRATPDEMDNFFSNLSALILSTRMDRDLDWEEYTKVTKLLERAGYNTEKLMRTVDTPYLFNIKYKQYFS
jgi:hypothetical protein